MRGAAIVLVPLRITPRSEFAPLRRTHVPGRLAPADALREAALALRDHRDADGRRRFAAPRYWAAFVAYGG